jgi:hypothetical protein
LVLPLPGASGAFEAQLGLADSQFDVSGRRAWATEAGWGDGRGGQRNWQERAGICGAAWLHITKSLAPGEDLIGVDTMLSHHACHRGIGAPRLSDNGPLELIRMLAIGAALRRWNDWSIYCVHN